MEKQGELPHYEQTINMLHEGQITETAFNQLLLQDQELRQHWQHHVDLKRALQDEDFRNMLRQNKS